MTTRLSRRVTPQLAVLGEFKLATDTRLGLPVLPVVEWPDDDEDPEHGLHWKTVFLTGWAAGRPFVWLDDETTDADRRWVASNHSGRALLQRVDPSVGLTDADFEAVRRWLRDGDGAT